MWNLIGWCTTGSRQGGTAKCPEPSLATRLADKGRTWGIGPIFFVQRMVQSPWGPCEDMLVVVGGRSYFHFALALSLWFFNVFDTSLLDLHFTQKRRAGRRPRARRACKEQLCSRINPQKRRNTQAKDCRTLQSREKGDIFKGARLLLRFPLNFTFIAFISLLFDSP